MSRLADPSVPTKEKEKVSLSLLGSSKHCGADKGTLIVRSTWREVDVHKTQSCVRPDYRGWGNDAAASESVQDSVGACEAHCNSNSCSYWTYDPTAVYGQPLCWIWVGGPPA